MDLPDKLPLPIFGHRLETPETKTAAIHSLSTTSQTNGHLLAVRLTCKRFSRIAMEMYYTKNTFVAQKGSCYYPVVHKHEVFSTYSNPTIGHLLRTLELRLYVSISLKSLEQLLAHQNEWRFVLGDNGDTSQQATTLTEWQRSFPNLVNMKILLFIVGTGLCSYTSFADPGFRCMSAAGEFDVHSTTAIAPTETFARIVEDTRVDIRAKNVDVRVENMNCAEVARKMEFSRMPCQGACAEVTREEIQGRIRGDDLAVGGYFSDGIKKEEEQDGRRRVDWRSGHVL
jgi:hypothetical protein